MTQGNVKSTKMTTFIKTVERVGNKLPDPFILFGIFAVFTLIISLILSKIGVEASFMEKGAKTLTIVKIENLLTFNKLRQVVSDFPTTYVNFPSLKLVLIMMMAIGVVEETGFFDSVMRKYLLKAPKGVVTAVFIFACVNANVMSDAGVILTLTLGGVVFASIGRSPILGIMLGYAACNGGYCASLLVAGADALVAGITEQVAVDAGFHLDINPLCNYYFMAAATIVLTVVLTIFTEKFIMKLFPEEETADDSMLKKYELTDLENRGLKFGMYGFISFVVIMLILTLPSNAFFRNAAGGFLPKSPLLSSIVVILFFLFLFIGVSYGIGIKKIASGKDVSRLLQAGAKKSAPLMVTFLTCALFMDLLNKSNILRIIAIKMAELIKAANVGPLFLLVLVIILTAMMNPFMTSASTKWILLAPMVVPVFGMIGVNPAYAQLAYRIGDSATNIISPLHPAITVIIGLMAQYNSEKEKKTGRKIEEAGFGTIFSLTLPYSIVILVTLTILMVIWYVLRLPIGLGISTFI
ncbi:AbgT family transporter [Fusobacterium ulcerans]|uniref:AbgT family transporter n=1 Tax=Fusobacterium ulcerans TaxID=861 RepID=UPI0026F1E9BD|nr:AbgT family transporter [Fusobacterium ulcerans]